MAWSNRIPSYVKSLLCVVYTWKTSYKLPNMFTSELKFINTFCWPSICVILVLKFKPSVQLSPQYTHILAVVGLYLCEHSATQETSCRYNPPEHSVQFVAVPTHVVQMGSHALQNRTLRYVPSLHDAKHVLLSLE